MSGDRRGRALRRRLERDGWVFAHLAGGHYRGTHPDAPDALLVLPATPGEGRAELNILAQARRLVRQAV